MSVEKINTGHKRKNSEQMTAEMKVITQGIELGN